ncbi:MAG: ROK family protein [Dehalococcoidia bacterium]|nr:ROK family protein [Dehalococcoidia bacterium]
MNECFIIAIDIGGTNLRVALADGSGKLIARNAERTQAEKGPQNGVERLKTLIRKTASCVDFEKVRGIAVASAGPIDPARGVILTPPSLPTWRNVPLKALLEEEFRLPVWLEHDADMAALGENRLGSGRGCNHLIYITVSTGIGGGVITGGELLRGSRISASELGHMVVDPQGPMCNCGGRGHLEAMASGPAIALMASKRISRGESSRLSSFVGSSLSEIRAEMVVQAARDGDALACEVMRNAGTSLGFAIVSLIHIFDPQVVIIGGGVSNAGELLLGPIREVIAEQAMPDFKNGARVVCSSLGDDSGILVAVTFALDKLQAMPRRE